VQERDHHYRAGKKGLVLYLSTDEHAALQSAAERWQMPMATIARNAIAEAVSALSVAETPREAKARQEREALELRKAMAAERLARVEPVVRPTRPVRPPPPLDMRDGFDDLAERGWDIGRPKDGERHRLGYLPRSAALRIYGAEHVADPRGIAYVRIEQGTWRRPLWTVWRRVERPRSVIYTRVRVGPAFADRAESVAEAAAKGEQVALECVRQYLAGRDRKAPR
jgi:hypothetical protein